MTSVPHTPELRQVFLAPISAQDYLSWQQHKQAGTTEVNIPADFPTYLAERKEEIHRQLTTIEQLLKEEKLPDVRLVKRPPLSRDRSADSRTLLRYLGL